MENKDIETCKLLYNTERVKLYVPEYGRNVQKMVDYLKTIEDRDKRNEQARAIIKVMEILNPSVHLQDDYEHKLWDHLFIISGFDLDVDAPYPMPAPESLHERPEMIPIKNKEDGDVKTSMIRSLAIYMRQQYLIWNKDTVSDETIFQDIEKLSDFRIKVPEGMSLGRVDSGVNFARPGINPSKSGRNQNRQRNNQKNHRKK